MTLIRIACAFAPVSLFLWSLLYIDSYKLVGVRRLLTVIGAGLVAAVGSYVVNQQILDRLFLTHIIAPAVEEILKFIPVLILLRTRRIGFVIDAAICGFATGAGFALIENLYYMSVLPQRDVAFWIVRGFGTAVMHGGTTAIAAMITQSIFQRRESQRVVYAFPGLAAAFILHAIYNLFLLSPLASALLVTVTLPPLLVFVFAQTERYVQSWLGSGFDVDSELLQAIGSDDFISTRAGRYLQSLRDHFAGAVVADMLCYLRISAELSLRAKGVLMLRESGLPVTRDAETPEKLAELQYLKTAIGRTGQLALAPILRRSSHDLWQLQLLEG